MDLPAKEGNDFPLSEFLKERRVKRRVFKKGPKGKRRHKPKVLSFLEKTHVYFFQNEQKLLTNLQMIKIAQLSRLLNVRKSVSRRNGISY